MHPTENQLNAGRSRAAVIVALSVTIAALGTAGLAVAASGGGTGTTANTVSTAAGLKKAKWGSNVRITYGTANIRYRSNGLPNHARQAEYAVPNDGVRVPTAATAHAATDPTKAQSYDFTIPTNPKRAASTTATSLGTIGVMISGAALVNPYEGDGSTVATAENFTVKNAAGKEVAFLDTCSGHPTPMGDYHYVLLKTKDSRSSIRCFSGKVDSSLVQGNGMPGMAPG